MITTSINKNMKLSEHFTLGELTKTSYDTLDKNIPSRAAIENLRNICKNWLEDLRYMYNVHASISRKENNQGAEVPIIINSGFRSEEVNRLSGGARGSNHLTGCAVDIHCNGPEQMIRMAAILLDNADFTLSDFDELILEKRGSTCWVHLAVRPSENRQKILFDCK